MRHLAYSRQRSRVIGLVTQMRYSANGLTVQGELSSREGSFWFLITAERYGFFPGLESFLGHIVVMDVVSWIQPGATPMLLGVGGSIDPTVRRNDFLGGRVVFLPDGSWRVDPIIVEPPKVTPPTGVPPTPRKVKRGLKNQKVTPLPPPPPGEESGGNGPQPPPELCFTPGEVEGAIVKTLQKLCGTEWKQLKQNWDGFGTEVVEFLVQQRDVKRNPSTHLAQ